jgi:heptosyltransferase-1
MRVLIVKVSSLGDVVHNMPVVADIRHAYPDARIDWVVEEGFADIVRLVRGVNEVIPFALRRWRKSLWSADTRRQIATFRERLRDVAYDAVLDTQGLVKTALVAAQARLAPGGYVAGLANRTNGSSYESPVRWFYDRKITIATDTHVVTRSRQMVAAAMGYTLQDPPEFGLRAEAPLPFDLPPLPYVTLVHATSRADKGWPMASWVALGQELLARGYAVVLPWGSAGEHAVSEAIHQALAHPHAVVPPRMSLATVTALLQGANATVGVDTGLVHIAAALDRPTIELYNFSTAWRTGGFWSERVVNLGAEGAPPTLDDVRNALHKLAVL